MSEDLYVGDEVEILDEDGVARWSGIVIALTTAAVKVHEINAFILPTTAWFERARVRRAPNA